MGNAERTKADEANFFAAGECFGYCVENAIDGCRGIRLREIGLVGNGGYEIILVHVNNPPR
jgi:hypothetical protein